MANIIKENQLKIRKNGQKAIKHAKNGENVISKSFKSAENACNTVFLDRIIAKVPLHAHPAVELGRSHHDLDLHRFHIYKRKSRPWVVKHRLR